MEKSALKRIMNIDMKLIDSQNLEQMGIYIKFNEENIFEAKAMIVGPPDSIYEDGYLFFNIQFPKNYPYSPPDVAYVSRNNIRIHPNLYVRGHSSGLGKVCLSILGTWSGPKWTTIMNISTVLMSIQSILDGNPLHNEPGQEKNKGPMNDNYNEIVQYESMNTLLLKNLLDPPESYEIFMNEMIKEFTKNKGRLDTKIELWKQCKKNCSIDVPIYRIKGQLNYDRLFKLYKSIQV